MVSFIWTTLVLFVLAVMTVGAFLGWKMRKWYEEFKRS